jgi:hypothetical protein
MHFEFSPEQQEQRNIIGERVPGLPADVRVDKYVPFNENPAKG